MEPTDPVAQLDKIFLEDLPQDWEISGCQEAILGVPEGTVLSLLRQINEKKLWPSLYEVAKRHSDQWMLDLIEFFPQEEAFVEPLVSFLLMSETEHGKICFAQSADEWAWGANTMHLLPKVIERVRQILKEAEQGKIRRRFIPTFEHVIKQLAEMEAKFHLADKAE